MEKSHVSDSSCCYLFSIFFQFFTDPCASSPCLHGNCSRSDDGKEGEAAYTCVCSEGYEGGRCDQILMDLPPAEWDPSTPPAPELATPAASTTAAATQPPTTTTTVPPPTTALPSTTVPPPTTTDTTTTTPPPTLQPWQPKAGQRLLVVSWEADRVRYLLIHFGREHSDLIFADQLHAHLLLLTKDMCGVVIKRCLTNWGEKECNKKHTLFIEIIIGNCVVITMIFKT